MEYIREWECLSRANSVESSNIQHMQIWPSVTIPELRQYNSYMLEQKCSQNVHPDFLVRKSPIT